MCTDLQGGFDLGPTTGVPHVVFVGTIRQWYCITSGQEGAENGVVRSGESLWSLVSGE